MVGIGILTSKSETHFLSVGLVQVWISHTYLKGIGIVDDRLELPNGWFCSAGIVIELEIGVGAKLVFQAKGREPS